MFSQATRPPPAVPPVSSREWPHSANPKNLFSLFWRSGVLAVNPPPDRAARVEPKANLRPAAGARRAHIRSQVYHVALVSGRAVLEPGACRLPEATNMSRRIS